MNERTETTWICLLGIKQRFFQDTLDTRGIPCRGIPCGYMLLRKFIFLMAEYTLHLANETKRKFAPSGPRPLCSLTGHDVLLINIFTLLGVIN
jgi:hypothetical protein